MSAIQDLSVPWAGHTGLEVETFLKQQIGSAIAAAGGKIGFVEMVGTDLKFYDYEGGTTIATIPLGGDVYNISIDASTGQVFYILADETEKIITITPSTTVSAFGSQDTEPFPEGYSYVVAVNTGGGYVNRITGEINVGESGSFDIRPFIATGDNYIRVAVTGLTSGQTKTVVLTGTLTTLTMSCNHAWQNVWHEDESYTITGIRFAGSIVKYLHVALDGVEFEPVPYSAGQSYTTSATTYTIPASAFPASGGSGVHTVTLWMAAQGISTPVSTFYIMCAAEEDTTPMVAINNITPLAVNFTSDTILGYAVYNANEVRFGLSATLGSTTYPVASNVSVSERVEGERYSFAYPLEIDTGANAATLGTLTATATPYNGATSGPTHTVTTALDNTYSYIATPGALFYMNAATRDNGQSNYQSIVNEMGASQDGNFAASYTGTWSGFSWSNDGWIEEQLATTTGGTATARALSVPAGSSVTFTGFAPLFHVASYSGFTLEMLLKCGHPSDYDTPVFSAFSNGAGLKIYPTKIVVLGSTESNEVLQSINLSENQMTHLTITFTKNYEGINGRNLVSIFVNGISNVNFAFSGTFGDGDFTIGQPDTDAYLYKMRVYGSALEPQAVFNNFLNAIVDNVEYNRRDTFENNNILDGDSVDYAACKAAGYNVMVVEMDSDAHDIPSFTNQASYDECSLRFEYADHPEWNVTIDNVSLDGQGTTSKLYYRWNLRAKTNSDTVWTYADETTEIGKSGYFAGPNYSRVDRITAKKNYASSMQGHKMGFTGLYNDLFKAIGLGENLPNEDYRVAVYELPFVGFKHIQANDTYEFIGLYTTGPDKNSKVTFGYSSSYNSLLSIEGPNHAPRGTRFITPWVDVTYDYQDETLKFGGEEGWDCDGVGGGLSSDKQADAAAILALYTSEWKPAYDIVFHCSPYIASIAETGYASITAINNNLETFLSGSTNGVSNQLMSFYDTNYDLWFYRTSTGKFENLTTVEGSSAHNVRTYLGLTGSPTTAQIKTARAAKFKSQMGNYWDLDQTLFHYCYCILFGVTDNFAKNSYPFKFEALASSNAGNRWGWREDDLDTVLATDNNGRNTKSYSVEHGDLLDGVEIYQGGNSALWVLIRDNYQTEIREMMIRVAQAAAAIATTLGIQGDGLHNSLFNLTSYYCWEQSSRYFSATLYEKDRRWSYLEPWLISAGAVYNNVPPLTQALGDQYQAEKLWMERRIAYIFSKYRIGAFSGDNAGYNAFAFTLAQPFTFNITPAIDLYPVVSLANSGDRQGTRTSAGDSVAITMDLADGQTTNYVHGGDWIASLGNLSTMRLSPRGGSSDIAFSIEGARIQDLQVGNTSGVTFNATSLAVKSPTITSIDARNTTTVTNSVDLMECPRLRSALFGGSGATGLLLPVGAKLTEVSFPSNATRVFMHSLPFLTAQNLTLPTLSGISSLYVNNCPAINPLTLLKDVLNTSGNNLQYVTLAWKDTLIATSAEIQAMFDLTDKAGYVDYQTGGSPTDTNGDPILEGPISSSEEISASTYARLEDTFPKLEMDFDMTKVYLDFADSTVESIALANWDTNNNNVITWDEANAVTSLGTLFRTKAITSFDELRFFTGLTTINGSSNTNNAFGSCTSLTSVTLPKSVRTIGNYAFTGCTALANINLDNVTTINNRAFYQTPALAIDVNCPDLTTLVQGAFEQSGIATITSLGNITSLQASVFSGCTNLSTAVLPSGITSLADSVFYGCTQFSSEINLPNLTSIGQSVFNGCTSLKKVISLGLITTLTGAENTGVFRNCTALEEVTLPQTLTALGGGSFYNCSSLSQINLPNGLLSVGYGAFYNCSLLNVTIPSSVTTIGNSAFQGCSSLTEELNLPNLTSIGYGAFQNSGITKVTSLGRITNIPSQSSNGYKTFSGCSALEEVHLPSTLTAVGGYAFADDSNAAIYGAESLQTIGELAFSNSLNQNEIYFRDLVSMERGACCNVGVKKVIFGPNTFRVGYSGNIASVWYGAFECNNSEPQLEEVVFEGDVSIIGARCFSLQTKLESVKDKNGVSQLPQSITAIYNQAFDSCPFAIDVNLPNLITISDTAFSASGITKISNLGQITSVPHYLAQYTSNLTEITFPSTVTSVGSQIVRNSAAYKLTFLSATPPSLAGNGFEGNSFGELRVPSGSIRQYLAATNWIYRTTQLLPITNATNWIINGVYFQKSGNNYTTVANSDYSITMPIAINPSHSLTYNFGFVYDGTDGHQITYGLNSNNWYVSYLNALTSSRTYTWNNENIKFVRMTIKTSELANCSIYDNTSGEYVWRGSDPNLVQF